MCKKRKNSKRQKKDADGVQEQGKEEIKRGLRREMEKNRRTEGDNQTDGVTERGENGQGDGQK